jgi:AcrR family transcriptional regulator
MLTDVTPQLGGGRANQRKRTHDAIVRAATELMRTGREVTMPEIARTALVSEATAYRYFPDLASLLREAMADDLPNPAEAFTGISDPAGPVERVATAGEYLLRHVLARQGAVRAMIAATVAKPGGVLTRPVLRAGLIDHALAPLQDPSAGFDPAALAQLKLDLAVVISAEALFALTDLYGLTPQQAIASLLHTATTLTRAALRDGPGGAPVSGEYPR